MQTKTVLRLTAAVVVTTAAYMSLSVVGLWGVALAAPALLLAPSAGKCVRVREEVATAEAALAVWSRDHGLRG